MLYPQKFTLEIKKIGTRDKYAFKPFRVGQEAKLALTERSWHPQAGIEYQITEYKNYPHVTEITFQRKSKK